MFRQAMEGYMILSSYFTAFYNHNYFIFLGISNLKITCKRNLKKSQLFLKITQRNEVADVLKDRIIISYN